MQNDAERTWNQPERPDRARVMSCDMFCQTADVKKIENKKALHPFHQRQCCLERHCFVVIILAHESKNDDCLSKTEPQSMERTVLAQKRLLQYTFGQGHLLETVDLLTIEKLQCDYCAAVSELS